MSTSAVPFKLGERVRYVGAGSWQRGDGPRVEPGDLGVVIRTVEPESGTGLTIDHDDDGAPIIDRGTDGYSVVRFHDHPATDTAVSLDSLGRYQRVAS